MLRLADLLSSASRPDLQQLLASAPPLAPDGGAPRCLISGPPRSGKTSVLFHLAHACAARGDAVLLLCQRARLELAPPLLPEGVAHTSPAWGRVAIKYLENADQLLKYLAALHLLPDGALPSAILVDDLHALCQLSAPDARSAQRHRDMGLCRLLALLADAAAHLEQRAGRPCLLAAAELGSADGPRSPFLTRRWLPLTVALRPVGAGHHRLAVLAPPAVAAQQMQVDYSLSQSSLAVEALHPPPSPASVLPH